MTTYYLRVRIVRANAPIWEEVDEFIFQNRDNAVLDNGYLRYQEGAAIIVNNGSVSIYGAIPVSELGHIARLAGVQTMPTGQTQYAGKPEYVHLRGRRGSLRLHKNGTPQEQDFVRKAMPTAAAA